MSKAMQWLGVTDTRRLNDRHAEKVQRYAKEERRLWEDFRHGLILGTKKYVNKIRRTYLPPAAHDEMPQQKSLAGIARRAKSEAGGESMSKHQ